jgi:tetratricopeptide (TPR) repeat protein
MYRLQSFIACKLIFLLLFFCSISSAQVSKIDSLKNKLNTISGDDTLRITILFKLAKEYQRGDNLNDELNTLNEALVFSRKAGMPHAEGDALHFIGNHYFYSFQYDEAITYYNQSLSIRKKLGSKSKSANTVFSIGTCYLRLGRYDMALNYFIQALKSYEELQDYNAMYGLLNNIGGIYYNQNNFKKTLEYFLQALEAIKKTGNKIEIANELNNIGQVYSLLDESGRAMDYFKQALEVNKETGDKSTHAMIMGNIGSLYVKMKNFNEALHYLLKAAELNKELDDKINLTNNYTNIAEAYDKKNEVDKAIEYLNQALELGKETGDKEQLKLTYLQLSRSYSKIKKFDQAYYFHEKYSQVSDSLFSTESAEQIAEMETRYQTDKKEKENQLLNQTIKIKEVESSRQQLVILLIGTILLVLGFVAFVLVKQNRLKNKINHQLAEKNKIIEDQHKDIKDSIHYSKRIQEAILPPMPLWYETLPDSFVIYKPKDILSGDFYWLEKVNGTIYFAAADCTGHGVPGAMVSVVCSTALNRAVKEFNLSEPGPILDKVRELVLETFEKSESDVKDGMDISLVAMKEEETSETRTIKWAGANNPLWYLHDGIPKEITADKQPVGKIDNPKPFTTHTFHLQKGDLIYVFTDGYADQFGGLKGKKLKYKAFRDTILQNIHLNVTAQKTNIEFAFDQWKGKLEQVDDVCVIGVRV